MHVEIFDKAETEKLTLQQRLQVTSDELTCLLLLILAKDAGVGLPAIFDRLLANYGAFFNANTSGQLNTEKRAIRFYCGQMQIDVPTLNVLLTNLIARKQGIPGISSVLPSDSLPNLQTPKDAW
jgi:hypothetical protein